ncbi:serine/threonine-protein kinase [Candidatus Uabimicrobium amorphum]|uniref:Serine/threonine protein kinase n=1 Tax=Uabimicrobium amorphum TaxID=2596890 RepID=A0A5S9IQM1_UABAM|nr:serine/threonine-protein kinase [Candidatus Uabimicrobium amorphum]BBM86279.1 serine/threonine protein kinase [Candidatus Uabimicrobium amorphum]
MDNDTFRSLWSKILEQDSSHKSKEKTFSHDMTVPPQEQTFSGDGTVPPDSPSPTDTFSEDATVQPEDAVKKMTHSVTETTSPDLSTVQANFNVDQDYQNYEEINRGGMGIIYKAEQTKLQREVAIKKLIPGTEANKFLSESLVTAHLEHPNIVPVHELDRNKDGDILLAMKLVKGVSWKDLLYPQTPGHKEKAKKYDTQKHLDILINVCNAVSYAHSKGIVHCDLKPENIMIGDFGEVLVMDWGIAVNIDENHHKKHTLHKDNITTPMGTPCYMSPELAEGRGKNISYATDVYLLGGILYEILHRKPPHSGESLWLVLLAAKESKPLSLNEDVLPMLGQICHKAMAKESCDRYQSVEDFQIALNEYRQRHESILLATQANTLLDDTMSYVETNTKWEFWQKFKFVFIQFPGKTISPYWYFSSKPLRWLGCLIIAFVLLPTIPFLMPLMESIVSANTFLIFIGIITTLTLSAPFIFSAILISIFLSYISICLKIIQWFSSLWLPGLKKVHVFPESKLSPTEIYPNLVQAMTLYEQAIILWPENKNAQEDKIKLHTKLADLALDFQDTKLASVHLEKLKGSDSKDVQELHRKLYYSKIEEKCVKHMLWVAKMGGCIFFYSSTAFVAMLASNYLGITNFDILGWIKSIFFGQ